MCTRATRKGEVGVNRARSHYRLYYATEIRRTDAKKEQVCAAMRASDKRNGPLLATRTLILPILLLNLSTRGPALVRALSLVLGLSLTQVHLRELLLNERRLAGSDVIPELRLAARADAYGALAGGAGIVEAADLAAVHGGLLRRAGK